MQKSRENKIDFPVISIFLPSELGDVTINELFLVMATQIFPKKVQN